MFNIFSIDLVRWGTTDVPVIYLILYIIFSILITIVMFNMLVALMATAYGSVVENAESEWLRDIAIIIAEIQASGLWWFDINERNFPRYVHYLVPAKAIKRKQDEASKFDMHKEISLHKETLGENMKNQFEKVQDQFAENKRETKNSKEESNKEVQQLRQEVQNLKEIVVKIARSLKVEVEATTEK